MKLILKYIFAIFLFAAAFSCSSDDDICVSGEATPRLKIKFKDKNNKLIRLTQLYIDVDYGSGAKQVISSTSVDSVFVPMKIDGSGVTDFTVYTSSTGNKSAVKMQYTEESQYVSPACGIKKIYKNVSSTLTKADPVSNVELVQTEIANENKTHLYLIF